MPLKKKKKVILNFRFLTFRDFHSFKAQNSNSNLYYRIDKKCFLVHWILQFRLYRPVNFLWLPIYWMYRYRIICICISLPKLKPKCASLCIIWKSAIKGGSWWDKMKSLICLEELTVTLLLFCGIRRLCSRRVFWETLDLKWSVDSKASWKRVDGRPAAC